jgi:hypothetical protein
MYTAYNFGRKERVSNIAGDFLPNTPESIKQSYSNNDIATAMRRGSHTWASTHTFNGGVLLQVIFCTRLDISATSQFDGDIVMSGGLNIDHASSNIADFYTSQVSIYRNLVVSAEGDRKKSHHAT